MKIHILSWKIGESEPQLKKENLTLLGQASEMFYEDVKSNSF